MFIITNPSDMKAIIIMVFLVISSLEDENKTNTNNCNNNGKTDNAISISNFFINETFLYRICLYYICIIDNVNKMTKLFLDLFLFIWYNGYNYQN